jgi:hypothetical protein
MALWDVSSTLTQMTMATPKATFFPKAHFARGMESSAEA